MKIDLNLSDIYQDEDGYKMKLEFVDLVATCIANDMKKEVRDQIEKEVNKKITDLIVENVENKMSEVLSQFLDYEYTEVTSWGQQKGKWTVRSKIADCIKESVGFERKDYWSSNKESPFTKLLLKAIDENIKPLTEELRKTVDSEFKKACILEASNKLKEQFGLK